MQWWKRWLGNRGERIAARHLRKKGYRILRRQWRGRIGEIDLIALDGERIVFVEVKSASTDRAGAPFEKIDREKQRKVSSAALEFLKTNELMDKGVRFDVVTVDIRPGSKPLVTHYIGAFEAAGDHGLW